MKTGISRLLRPSLFAKALILSQSLFAVQAASFHPVVTSQGIIQGWAQGNVYMAGSHPSGLSDGNYTVVDASGAVRGYVQVSGNSVTWFAGEIPPSSGASPLQAPQGGGAQQGGAPAPGAGGGTGGADGGSESGGSGAAVTFDATPAPTHFVVETNQVSELPSLVPTLVPNPYAYEAGTSLTVYATDGTTVLGYIDIQTNEKNERTAVWRAPGTPKT